jgi:hypothetical protein
MDMSALRELPNLLAFLSLLATVIGAYYAWAQFRIVVKGTQDGAAPRRQHVKELLGICVAIIGVVGIVTALYQPQPQSEGPKPPPTQPPPIDGNPPPPPPSPPLPPAQPIHAAIAVLQPVWTGTDRRFEITARITAVTPVGAPSRVPTGVVTFRIDDNDVIGEFPVQGGEAVLNKVLDRGRRVTIRAIYKPGSQSFLGSEFESMLRSPGKGNENMI